MFAPLDSELPAFLPGTLLAPVEAHAAALARLHASVKDLALATSTVRACRQRRCKDREKSRLYFMMVEHSD